MALPDFPAVKQHLERALLTYLDRQVGVAEPLLGQIRRSVIHEGHGSTLTRADGSQDEMTMREVSASMGMSREMMHGCTLEQILEVVRGAAEQFAEQQARAMFETIESTAEEFGNSISAKELGPKEAFLETQRRLRVDFDPQTLEPINQVIVMHPSAVERFKEQAEEWDRDPEFVAELERIRQTKIAEWRAREDSRKLVD